MHTNPIVRFAGTVFALAMLLTGCGGTADAQRTHAAPVAIGDNGNQTTPSPQGPYGIITTAGILVKAKDTAGARAMSSLFKAVHAVEHERFDLVDGLSLIDVAPQDIQNTLAALNANPAVAYAEPNYIYTAFVVPNDPDLGRQYHLNQTSDIDIDAPEAWDLQTGNNVVVAVIDSGVDYNHPDLRNNIWSNAAETPNNGVDDDNNGFVDDIRGWDFANNDNNPMDDNRHGTHVSGIIAAQGNNGTGGSGVAWRARIMPLKFLAADGSGSTANAIRAVQYATRMGAKVSNNSWGGPANSQALRDAITAANAAGMVFVAAAGNAASNNDTTASFPANYPIANIISVAATTSNDALASFSNFGARTVHVAAPGANIYSTVPNNSYALLSGTSMASPVVTGIVALLLSTNSSLSVDQMTKAITSTTDPVAALRGRVVTGGRVNALRALQAVGGSTTPPVTTPVPVSVTPATGSATVGNTIQFQATGGTPPYTWSVTNTAVGTVNATSGLFTAALAGSTSVVARDSVGVQGQATATVTAAPAALELSPRTSQVATRQSLQLTASGGTPPYRWSSNNTAVATVNSTGLVSGVSAGSATVSVTDSLGAVQSTVINVITPTAVLPITPAAPIVAVGRSVALTATGATAPIAWTSTQPGVASVDAATGVTTGVTVGTATINMTDGAGNTGSVTVTVRQVQVQTTATTVAVGSTITATASGGAAPYRWSSSTPAIADVSAAGAIMGISAGSATITATDADGIIGTSNTITVTAPVAAPVPVPISTPGLPTACTTPPTTSPITIIPATVTLPATWWVHFMATGGTPPYVWSVCSTTAGEISETTGWFHAGTQLGASSRVVVSDATGQQQVGTVTLGSTVIIGP